MSEAQTQKNNYQSIGRKSIPDHIIDGSITIDSIEAFGSILKQFPNNPELLKKYSDLLFKQNFLDMAAKSYGEAARLFIESGKMLQALVSKKLHWRIKHPSNEEMRLFLSSLRRAGFNQTPLRVFFDKLSPKEMLAVISSFVRVRLIAGKLVRKVSDLETDLYFIVSGTLKDTFYPSLEKKEKIHRKPKIYLSENDFFGEIYPFKKDKICNCNIETVTQVELVKISVQKLKKLCRKYPNIELGIIDLFKLRSGLGNQRFNQFIRKADRYLLPIKMHLEIPPNGSLQNPIRIDGYSSDISIGGICVILNSKSEHIPSVITSLPEIEKQQKIRISFPGETMELKVLGSIVWTHQVHFNGKKTLALGIQFKEDSPKLRGMLFMFANSLSTNHTGETSN
jgi:CRP-like cAMP-binding protein